MLNTTPRLLLALALLLPGAAHAGSPPKPSAPEGEAIGLYPLALPAGQEALQGRLAGQLHDGASSLPGVRAFDLIPRGACLADEGGCLAAAARSAGLTEIVSAQVSQKEKGYAIVLRLFDARTGDEKNTHKAQVDGGPLDLAGALEHGVCSLLGAAPCVGQVSVRTDPTGCKVGAFAPKLFVDGKEDQTLPLAKALSLPVGRHSIRAGSGEERRVRVSYGRETKLFCEVRAGTPELSDDVIDAAPLVLADKPAAVRAPQGAPSGALDAKGAPKLSPQAAGGRLLVAGGLALLAVAAGTGLYANLRSNTLDERYHAGALTDADKPAYSSVHAAGAVSLTAAILGGLGLVTGTTMALLAPPADAAPVKGGK